MEGACRLLQELSKPAWGHIPTLLPFQVVALSGLLPVWDPQPPPLCDEPHVKMK